MEYLGMVRILADLHFLVLSDGSVPKKINKKNMKEMLMKTCVWIAYYFERLFDCIVTSLFPVKLVLGRAQGFWGEVKFDVS